MAHPYQQGRARTSESGTRSTPVFWDDTEKQKVARESFRILTANPKLSNLEAVNQAQKKVLKPARFREVSTFGKFSPWIKPLWDDIQKKQSKNADAKKGIGELFEAQPETVPPPMHAEAVVAFPPDHPAPPESKTVVFADDGRVFVPAARPVPPAEEGAARHTVRWVESEKMTIARGVARRMKPGGIERLDALRATVQMDLPDYRQREINTWHMVESWIEPMIKQAKNDMILEEIREREAHEQAEREAAARIEAARLEEQRVEQEARERELEIERRVNVRVQALSFDALIRAFAKKMAGDMLTAMREELHNGMMDEVLDVLTQPSNPAPVHTPTDTLAPKEVIQKVTPDTPKLPKIMIVGLFPNQQEDVERAFRGTIEFEFVKSQKMGGQGEGGHGMINRCGGCEVVLAMGDQSGLDVEQKRKHLTIPFRRINGSSSNLKRWLTAYLNGEMDLSGEYSAGVGQ